MQIIPGESAHGVDFSCAFRICASNPEISPATASISQMIPIPNDTESLTLLPLFDLVGFKFDP